MQRIDILKTLFNLAVFTCAIIAGSKGGILGFIACFWTLIYGYVLLGKDNNNE